MFKFIAAIIAALFVSHITTKAICDKQLHAQIDSAIDNGTERADRAWRNGYVEGNENGLRGYAMTDDQKTLFRS